MIAPISLRWRLILISGSLALLATLILGVVLHQRTQKQLLQQIEKTLETKCDEVVTVLENPEPYLTLGDLLVIETHYRFSPSSYFYQIRDAGGGNVARSENLGGVDLPIPVQLDNAAVANQVHHHTVHHPLTQGHGMLIRSERLALTLAGREPATFIIQTAVSMKSFNAAMRATLFSASLLAAGVLVVVFLLLWFVTTRALQPVSAMTRKASKITARNLRQRLPVTGRADELDELASVLNGMLDRLGSSLHQMEQFSSDAAHQLRTPLTRIRGELDLILRSDVKDPPRSQLERIQDELERLSRVCGRLLLLARLDQPAGDPSLFDDSIDLEEIVAELIDQMAPLAQDRGIDLRCGETSPARVRGSRPLLVEALLNLLDNAIRFTPPGGFVAVSIAKRNDEVHLAVEDSGPGVPPAERMRIFHRFYRIGGTGAHATGEGSGLGLAIVEAIAQAHGGTIKVVGAAGRIFLLVLPSPGV